MSESSGGNDVTPEFSNNLLSAAELINQHNLKLLNFESTGTQVSSIGTNSSIFQFNSQIWRRHHYAKQ